MTTRARKKKSDALKFLDDLIGVEQTLGDLLVTIRETDEMTQKELAKRLELSTSHLCDIEKGRKTVSAGRAARFAKALGYSEALFVQLAVQEQLDEAGLDFRISVEAA